MTKFTKLAQHMGLALTLSTALADPALPAPTPDALRPQIEKLLAEQVSATGPGLAVLVARGDQLLFRGARGLANVELGVPLSPAHRFRIGSVTKQFVVVALLRLAEQGRLRLEDPLAKYLPDYPQGDRIQLLHLLNHTAGVSNYTAIPGYMGNPVRRDLSTQELVAEFQPLALDFEPGSGWNYSNSGYVLLGAVLEAVTKQPWHAAVKALLQELQMDCTSTGDERTLIPQLASGYSASPAGEVAPAGIMSLTQAHAAGAMSACVDDLLRWNRALHGGRLLSDASYRRMTTPEAGHAARAGFGFGIVRSTVRGATMLQHGGGIFGYTAMLMVLPEQHISVVVLKNSDAAGPDVDQLARRLAALALGRPYPDGEPQAVTPETLQRLAGAYATQTPGSAWLLRIDAGALQAQQDERPAQRLIPLPGGVWQMAGALSRFEDAGPDAQGRQQLRFYAAGEGDGVLWTRTGEAPPPAAATSLTAEQLSWVTGHYVGEQLSLQVFQDEVGGLRAQVPGQPAVRLSAQGPLRLVASEVGAALEFAPPGAAERSATLVQGPLRLVLKRQAR